MIPFHEIDIPKLAFLEHEIFMEAHSLGALSVASGNVLERMGLNRDSIPPPPYLQTRLLSSLYLLLVFPKELWARTEVYELTIKRIEKEQNIQVLAGGDLPAFLRHIRNAVSHARVSVSPNGITTFVDIKPNGKENFRRVLSLDEVQILLSAVGLAFGELREGPNRSKVLQQLGANP